MSNRLLDVADSLASAVARRVTKLEVAARVRTSWAATRHGRLALVGFDGVGITVGGLRLARLEVRAEDVGVRWSRRPQLVVGSADVAIELRQRDLDEWSRRLDLPARLVLRDGRLVARFGVAGLRLAQMEMDVRAVGGGVQLVPRRLTGLGVDLRTGSDFAVRIPLPNLPVSPSITDVQWHDGRGEIRFGVPELSLPLTRETLGHLRDVAGRVARSTPEPPAAPASTSATLGSASQPPRPGIGTGSAIVLDVD